MPSKKIIYALPLVLTLIILVVYFGFYRGKLEVTNPVPRNLVNQFSSLFYQDLSLKYPKNYSVQDYSPAFKVLTVSKDSERRLEIFHPNDFGSRAEPADLKEKFTLGSKNNSYGVWLFYPDNDEQSRSELHQIYNSIKIK